MPDADRDRRSRRTRRRTTPCTLFISQEGYLKKITPQSLRMSGEQRFKEGDSLALYLRDARMPTSFWSSRTTSQVYKARAC